MTIDMKSEINTATKFILSHIGFRSTSLYNTLSRHLKARCDSTTLNPLKPLQGSGARCISITDASSDPLLAIVSTESGYESDFLGSLLPTNFSIWCDPGCVTFRYKDYEPIRHLIIEKGATSRGNSPPNSKRGSIDFSVTRNSIKVC
jgi:hypothetical protein